MYRFIIILYFLWSIINTIIYINRFPPNGGEHPNGIYGANNKEKAAYYVLVFTFTSSLFMLLAIVITTYMINTTSCLIYSQFILSLDLQILLWIGIMLGILVKTPLFPFHV